MHLLLMEDEATAPSAPSVPILQLAAPRVSSSHQAEVISVWISSLVSISFLPLVSSTLLQLHSNMDRFSVLTVCASVLSVVNAFCVDFTSGERCTGTVVGKFNGSTGTGCQTGFIKVNSSESVPAPGASFDVVIQPQSNETRSGVAFYGQPDCEVLIGFGNVPVCTGVGAWSSFKVIGIDEADDQLTNLDPAPVLSIPTNATAVVGRGDRLPSPSASALGIGTPTTSSDGMMPAMGGNVPGKIRRTNRPNLSKRVAHGSIHHHQGRSYRYHQVAARAWRGVPIEEWNDELHQRDTRDFAMITKRGQSSARHHARAIGPVGGIKKDSAKRGVSSRNSNPLLRRAISPEKCNLVRSCMIDNGNKEGFAISDAGAALLRALEFLNPDGTHWEFLREPFVVEVTDDSLQSLGLIYAQTDEHSGVTSCTEPGNEASVFQSALELGAAGTTVTDMRIDLKLREGEGVTNTLFVSTRKTGSEDMSIHPICQAVQVFY